MSHIEALGEDSRAEMSWLISAPGSFSEPLLSEPLTYPGDPVNPV
jgi:hypothetical protein